MKLLFILIISLILTALPAQEQVHDLQDWDFDTIFDESFDEILNEEDVNVTEGKQVTQLVNRRGVNFSASYDFNAGIAPSWHEIPWSSDRQTSEYYLDRFLRMRTSFTLDAQISSVFRVINTVYFQIPEFKFSLGDFFFDYNFFNTVYARGGKYNHAWGISPNYSFTNLLSRVPKDKSAGESFILKFDVPIGIGGIQVLAMTRADLMGSSDLPKLEDFGFGGKYNLALRRVDYDMGFFYQKGMPLRSFLSIKTTIKKTELYSEYLLAVDLDEPYISGAFNIGFMQDFFDGKLNLNGELFYNAEKDSYWYHPETNIREEGVSPFIEGLNIALNLSFKPWEKWNPRLFLRALFAPMENSVQLIPGFRINPWQHIELYMAAPVSLGSKNGYYYKNTFTKDKQDRALPFALIFLVSLRGSAQFGYYY